LAIVFLLFVMSREGSNPHPEIVLHHIGSISVVTRGTKSGSAPLRAITDVGFETGRLHPGDGADLVGLGHIARD
jgi:hypothetical protein